MCWTESVLYGLLGGKGLFSITYFAEVQIQFTEFL